MFDWVSAIGSIILVDLVLSGDNALVIGATASGLPKKQRWSAIVVGGGGAILLRIRFKIAATFLLRLPLLQASGGIILLYIAIHLLVERSQKRQGLPEKTKKARRAGNNFGRAMLTIIIADATMSLDNILAIGALADGAFLPLSIGLFVSIALILLGSALVATLIERLPLLLDLASLILAWTASNMLLNDIRLGPLFASVAWTQFVFPILALGIVLFADVYLWWRDTRRSVKRL